MEVATEKVRELEQERDAALVRAKTLEGLWEEGNRSPSDEEKSQFDKSLARADEIAGQIDLKRKLIEATGRKIAPLDIEPLPEKGETVVSYGTAARAEKSKPQGILFAQMACALGLHRGNIAQAINWADRTHKDDHLLRWALEQGPEILNRATVAEGDTTTVGWAEEVVGFSREAAQFIELLRAQSVMMRVPMREVQFGTVRNYEFPRQSGGIGGNWVGENAAIPVDALAFDNVALTPYKASSIVVITRELAQYSDPSAMALVRDDMIEGLATFIDSKFVTNDAVSAGISPAGVFNGGATGTASAASTQIERITADLLELVNFLDAANVPSTSRTLIMNTQERNLLVSALDSLGNYPFRDEVGGGSIWGMQVVASNTMTATNVGLVEGTQIIRGVGQSPMVDVSGDATVHMSDTPSEDLGGALDPTPIVSFYQRDLLGTRTQFETSWVKRHDACAALTTSVNWAV